MRLLRNILIALFAVTTIVFAIFEFNAFKNRDNEAPVISAAEEELYLSTSATEEEILQGMTAKDDRDGDVTNSLVVVSKSHFVTGTTVKVNYAAFDSHNNVATFSRRLTYTDYRKPRFSMSAPLRFVSRNNPDYLGGITASDVIDGDISSQIKLIVQDSTYSTADTRTIPMILQVTNSVGDTSEVYVTADIETQYNFDRPSPSLSTYMVYTKPGVPVDYQSYLSGILKGGEKHSFDDEYTSDMVMIDASGVNIQSEGTYKVTYMLQVEGEIIGKTDLYVVVEADPYE